MANTYTSSGTAASAASSATSADTGVLGGFNVTNLAAHIRGELDVDPDAAGGTVPDRVKNLIRLQGTYLWTVADWRFRQKLGTLSIASGGSTAALPADFAELDHRVLRTNDDYDYTLSFTEDPWRWQQFRDTVYSSSDTGAPAYALIYRDTDKAFPWWLLKFCPTSNAAYTYQMPYLIDSPWSRHARLATSFTGDDNDLVFTAKQPGPEGNDITVALTMTPGDVVVSVSGEAIAMTATLSTVTAAEIKTAIDADSDASELVHCHYAFDEDGTGTITEALTATNLSGPIEDDEYPPWDRTFDEGWRLRSLWACQKAFGKREAAKDTAKDFRDWLAAQQQENDEKVRLDTERIFDTLQDHAHTVSAVMDGAYWWWT